MSLGIPKALFYYLLHATRPISHQDRFMLRNSASGATACPRHGLVMGSRQQQTRRLRKIASGINPTERFVIVLSLEWTLPGFLFFVRPPQYWGFFHKSASYHDSVYQHEELDIAAVDLVPKKMLSSRYNHLEALPTCSNDANGVFVQRFTPALRR